MQRPAAIQLPQYQGYIWITILTWTFTLLGSAFWNTMGIIDNLKEDARLQAMVAFNKDINYRSWNASHGGVYAKISPSAIPNPHLTGLAERDKYTLDGDSLTLINPAYMTRQLHEIELQKSGIRGHITSLNPIRPSNQADMWETSALQRFEDGEEEVTSIETIDSLEYFRFMRPLTTEKACLPCHHQQGYQEGDIRGGISISIPLKPLREIAGNDIFRIIMAHFSIWVVGIFGAGIAFVRINEATQKKLLADAQLKESERQYRDLAMELKESNDVQELLIDIITHDLRNPAGVIQNISLMLNDEIPENEMIEIIKSSSSRLLEVMENAKTLAQSAGGEQIDTALNSLTKIVKDVANEFSTQLQEAGLKLTIDIESELQTAVNPIISEVFVNYMSNVIKYAGSSEHIIIDAEEDENSMIIRVKDQGETIPSEDRENIFLRSFQLSKGEKRGRGLGLAIVRRIATAHGGDVWVEPNEPRGNSFCLRLPKRNEQIQS